MASKTNIYSRLNTHMHSYIYTVNSKADPELIHAELLNLISEAIKMEVGLDELRAIFSSTIEESGSRDFEKNLTKRYAQGIERADTKDKIRSLKE